MTFKTLVSGYLLGLLLLSFFIGYVVGTFANIPSPIKETIEYYDLLFIIVFMSVLYVESIRKKYKDITKVCLDQTSRIKFKGKEIDLENASRIKIRKTLYIDLYSVYAVFNNSNTAQFICVAEDVEHLLRFYRGIIDKKLWLFWPLYILQIIFFLFFGFFIA